MIFKKIGNKLKSRLKKLLKKDGSYLIRNSIHNSKIDEKVKLYEPYSISDSEVLSGTYVATNSMVSMTKIGKFCSIGPNFLCGYGIHPLNGISTSPAFYSTKKQNGFTFSSEDKIEERKWVTIGNDVFIGMNVSILDGVKIGDGAVIGAGSVVTKDVEPYSICAGVPARHIRYRFTDNQIKQLLKIKWWDWSNQKLSNVEKLFFDVDGFIAQNHASKTNQSRAHNPSLTTIKISVITVCYNSEATIEATIKSVISQTAFDNIEYIIVDGSSQDGTMQIIEKYREKISKLISEPDSGIYNAMNKGVGVATGDYIQFLNSNDTYYSDSVIENVLKKAEEKGSDLIIGDVLLLHNNEKHHRSFNKIMLSNFFHDWFYHVCLFAKRDLFIKHGRFNEKYQIAADNDWIIPLITNNSITKSHIDIIIANFGLDGISANPENQQKTIKEIEEVLKNKLSWKNNFIRRLVQDRNLNRISPLHYRILNRLTKALGLKKMILSIARKKIKLTNYLD